MLKFDKDFNLFSGLAQENLNQCHCLFETFTPYIVSRDFLSTECPQSDNVPRIDGEFTNTELLEKKKPELGGSGKNAIEGDLVPPTIAEVQDFANANNYFMAGVDVDLGWIKTQRIVRYLLTSDPHAFLILSFIALNAKRVPSRFDRHLTVNQTLITHEDFEAMKLTRQQFRDALSRLQGEHSLITSTGTNQGTVATLISTDAYDINSTCEEPAKEPAENQQRTSREPASTGALKKVRSKERKKEEGSYVPTADGLARAANLFESIKRKKPDYPEPKFSQWANDIEKINRIDGVSWERIDAVIAWLPTGDFWWKNILSGEKLRKQFIRLELDIQSKAEEKLILERKNICFELKRLYSKQFACMQINKESALNTLTQKDVMFHSTNNQRFIKEMKSVFGADIED